MARLVAEGLTNGEIARRVGVRERTIRSQITDILWRLGIQGGHVRVKLARWVLAEARAERAEADVARLQHAISIHLVAVPNSPSLQGLRDVLAATAGGTERTDG